MPLYGSSPYNITGLTLNAESGAKGNPGPVGAQGPQGLPGFGPTGNTGIGISSLNFTNNTVNSVYSDSTVSSSSQISQLPGNYVLEITGTSGGNFSPLVSTEQLTNQTIIYDGDVNSNTFKYVRRLNFKNIKTNTPQFVNLQYVGPPSTPAGEPGQTIKLTYNVFNLGSSNASGGADESLVINNPGNIQTGYTGTYFNETENATSFALLNVAEQLVVVQPNLFGSNLVQVWKIDPDAGSIFYLSGYKNITSSSISNINGHHILIKKNSTVNSSKAFTVILPKEFTITDQTNRLFYSTYTNDSDVIDANFTYDNYKLFFSPNVIWQTDSYFCPSTNYDVVNFVSLGGRYIGIPGIYNTSLNISAQKQSIPSFPCKPNNIETFYRLTRNAVYGVCCKEDCTCDLSFDYECSGYFYEGATCGGVSGPCSNLGACCLFSSTSNKSIDCRNLTFCQCAGIASESGYLYRWNKFTGLKTSCDDFNCDNAMFDIGACCDGIGGCVEISSEECFNLNRYYQGNGVNCITSSNLNVCSDGNGACCDSGITCEAGLTGSTCLSQAKTYYGDGTTCGDFTCGSLYIPCYSIIENLNLTPGDEYEDGIIVGIFNPKQTKCFGSELFDGTIKSYNTLTGTTLQSCVDYLSKYDYSGYNFNKTTICDDDTDSYLMVVSKHPINIDLTDNLIDGNLNIHEFKWSNGSVAWGPLINISGSVVEEFTDNKLKYKEGYIYDATNESNSKLNLYPNSFLTCSSVRVDTDSSSYLENRPVQSFNGLWTRNNGLYNTIRLLSSEYFYYNIGSSMDGATLEYFIPQTSDMTVGRALSIYNINKPKTYEKASDWFVPSIDELAFIANHCKNTSDFNLNSRLLEINGTPLNGWYWSSTGSMDVSNNEGINTISGITHGSVAWAIKFDVDGNTENMIISKAQRTNTYQVRPIKFVRCDKNYYVPSDINFKLWTVPKLSEFIIDNQ